MKRQPETRREAWIDELTEDMVLVAGGRVKATPPHDRYPYNGVWHDLPDEPEPREDKAHA